MTALHIEIIEQDGVNVMMIDGPVDSATGEDFKSGLHLLAKMQVSKVVLDFKNLTYMNSSALGALLQFYRASVAHRRKIVICNQNKRIEKGMALLGLHHQMQTYPSRDKAIEALKMPH